MGSEVQESSSPNGTQIKPSPSAGTVKAGRKHDLWYSQAPGHGHLYIWVTFGALLSSSPTAGLARSSLCFLPQDLLLTLVPGAVFDVVLETGTTG